MSSSREKVSWRRAVELVTAIFVVAFLIGLSRLETRLYEISENLAQNKEFINTVVYFALINLNVILVCILSFMIFRNLIKLVVERRRGFFGSRLRSKLVMAFVLFALAPSVILFYVSTKFITTSFERWFSDNVTNTMNQTRVVGTQVYEQSQRRLENIARSALQRIDLAYPAEVFQTEQIKIHTSRLQGFERGQGLDGISVFDTYGDPLYSSRQKPWTQNLPAGPSPPRQKLLDFIRDFSRSPTLETKSAVVQDGESDRVLAAAAIRSELDGSLVGFVLVEETFEFQILRAIESILKEFSGLRPGAELIRGTFITLMVVITLLVLFAATWLGFYVARGITGPIHSLAEATKEVALGNYEVSVRAKSRDETGQLIDAFNKMTEDLQQHRNSATKASLDLQNTNRALELRRNYIEIILKHISAGVISLDQDAKVTSVNSAAERLLQLDGQNMMGKTLFEVVRRQLYDEFFSTIIEALQGKNFYNNQFYLKDIGIDEDIIVDATRTFGEDGAPLGIVMVFDDASKKLTAGRVAAWREVARRIAHEVKNPLTPIRLNSERLLRRYHDRFQGEDKDVFIACLENILAQVDSLRNLVNEFSKFSRLPTVKLALDDLNQVIREIVIGYRLSYPEVNFDLTGLSVIPKIQLDREQFKRVIINLLTNAIAACEANPEPPLIHVRTKYIPDAAIVRFEVADNGSGIPEKLRERVLEPYFSTKDGGTGLGLAIVNQIVSDHGGYLRLQSQQPRGTVVIMEFSV